MSETGQQPAKRDSIWSVPFVVLMTANFFQTLAAFMMNVTMPLYLDALGATTSMIGVVVGAFAITALLARPFAGPAFDSFSRKRLLMAAQAINCISMVCYGLVSSVPGLFAVRLLHGVGIGCAGPLGMSLVSEFLPESRMASGIGIYALSQALAQVIGPATGLYLIEAVGFSMTYFIAAGSLLLAIFGISLCKEPPRERLPYKFAPNRMFAREAVPKALVLCLFAIAFAGITSYLVLYSVLLGIEGMGVYFVVYALCLLATRPLFGRMADTFGSARVLLVGALFFAASYVLLWQVRDFWGFMVVAVIGSAGFGACVPLIQSMALASVPVERRGAASNTAFTGLDLGTLIGPPTAGFVIEALVPVTGGIVQAYSYMWLVMLVPLAAAFALILYWNIRR